MTRHKRFGEKRETRSRRVYEMSEDERRFWALQKDKHDQPFRAGAAAIQAGIDTVLKALGVDVDSSDEKLLAQMMSLDIFVKSYDNQPDVAPQIQGFYIFQLRYPNSLSTQKEPVAVAFIGNPNVDSSGQINVQIHWFDKMTMDIVKGETLKEQV